MKREKTCGSTPKASSDAKGAPVARTASTCFSEISSMASVNSLPMKPTDATVSARMPASAPKPTALTNRMATITGWNERAMTMMVRAGQVTHGGIRLRAAHRPTGSASVMPSMVDSTAISRLSTRPLISSSERVKSGGNRRLKNLSRVVEADHHAIPGNFQLRAGVDHVHDQRDRGHARNHAARKRILRGQRAHCSQSWPP